MLKHYELTYTVSKNLAQEEANSLFEKMLSYFPQAVKKEGEYGLFNLEFYTEPATIQDLEKKLKSESQIKKHMIAKKEAVRIMKTRARKTQIQTPIKEQKVEKVELKEIDKKLKEIFGE